MYAFLTYLLARLIWWTLGWWIRSRHYIACDWAGYDRPTRVLRGMPSAAQVEKAIATKCYLLDRRVGMLKDSAYSEDKLEHKRREWIKDMREFRSVVRARELYLFIKNLQTEYLRQRH